MREIAADPQCMLLVGPTGAGKTTLAASYTQKYPATFTDTVILRPVVMATIPSTASITNLLITLLSALGDPGATRGNIVAKEERLKKFFREKCLVELLILDELQHFVDRDSQRILQNASNWLKTFIKETKVACVLIGLQNDAEEVVDSNPQLARLFGDPYVLAPFEWDETKPGATREVFRDFLRELERLLPLQEPSHLADYETALRCFAACSGAVSYLMELVRSAIYLALEQERESLDYGLLSQAFIERLAPIRRGIPNPFEGDLPNLEELKKNQANHQRKRNRRGTNRRSKPRNPNDPPEEHLKDFF
jgi:hypothetical protein